MNRWNVLVATERRSGWNWIRKFENKRFAAHSEIEHCKNSPRTNKHQNPSQFAHTVMDSAHQHQRSVRAAMWINTDHMSFVLVWAVRVCAASRCIGMWTCASNVRMCACDERSRTNVLLFWSLIHFFVISNIGRDIVFVDTKKQNSSRNCFLFILFVHVVLKLPVDWSWTNSKKLKTNYCECNERPYGAKAKWNKNIRRESRKRERKQPVFRCEK